MLKKVLSVMLLAAVLIIVGGQNNQAEASEVYVGSYSDGTAVYLLTESIDYPRNTSWLFTCTVRAGRDYLDYGFEPAGGGRVTYRNSEGYTGYIDDGSSPVARAIYIYWRNNY